MGKSSVAAAIQQKQKKKTQNKFKAIWLECIETKKKTFSRSYL